MAAEKLINLDERFKRRTFLGGLGALSTMLAASVGSGTFTPNDNGVRIQKLLASSEPVNWLFTGDSITQGALHTSGWRSYPELFAERVRWELFRLHDVVINTGISGDTTGGLLQDMNRRIFQFNPQITSLMMGMNDCVKGLNGRDEFRGNLYKLIDGMEEHAYLPLLHTPNLISYPTDPTRNTLPAYVEIIREVAKKRNILLVDHYAHWQERSTQPGMSWERRPGALLYWLNDGSIHPNECGHRELANHLFATLGIYDPTSRTCRLFVE